jgi:hypothetical protein
MDPDILPSNFNQVATSISQLSWMMRDLRLAQTVTVALRISATYQPRSRMDPENEVYIKPGFLWDGHLSIYSCYKNPQVCPGGGRGQCAAGRSNASIACQYCEADKTWEDDGTCVACGNSNQVLVCLSSIALFIVICLVYVVCATKHSIQPVSHMLLFVSLLGTQVITVLQQLSIIGAISVSWAEPRRSFFRALDVIELDMDIMHPDCIKRPTPLEKYALNLGFVFAILALLVLMYLVDSVYVAKGASDSRHQRSCSPAEP